MNDRGILWERKVNKGLQKGYIEPKWGESRLQERMMRVRQEYMIYSDGQPDDLENIARITLREDYKLCSK